MECCIADAYFSKLLQSCFIFPLRQDLESFYSLSEYFLYFLDGRFWVGWLVRDTCQLSLQFWVWFLYNRTAIRWFVVALWEKILFVDRKCTDPRTSFTSLTLRFQFLDRLSAGCFLCRVVFLTSNLLKLSSELPQTFFGASSNTHFLLRVPFSILTLCSVSLWALTLLFIQTFWRSYLPNHEHLLCYWFWSRAHTVKIVGQLCNSAVKHSCGRCSSAMLCQFLQPKHYKSSSLV